MTITFGTLSGGTGLKFQTATEGTTATTAEAMDETGNITQTDVYAKKKTFQGEALVEDDHVEIKAGDTFDYNGVSYKVERAEYTRSNTGHRRVSITATAPFDSSGTEEPGTEEPPPENPPGE